MTRLMMLKGSSADVTAVSNLFIDKYMQDANDAQLKIYFYLLRMFNANLETSVSDIADKFNHTEKDVLRALRYWEKLGVLSLEYDSDRTLVAIRFNDLEEKEAKERLQPGMARPIVLTSRSISPFHPEASVRFPMSSSQSYEESVRLSASEAAKSYSEAQRLSAPAQEDAFEAPRVPEKRTYTKAELATFAKDSEVSNMFFVAQQYLGKPLSNGEMNSLLFVKEELHFSFDLIDHLLQYCIDRGKNFRYLEKVAINWAEQGITTWEEAQENTSKYDKNVYAIMNELGRSGSPTKKELEFIERWTKEYAFPTEVITEACQRASLATGSRRFEYAEGILADWKENGVHDMGDVARQDERHQRTKKASTKGTSNKFNQFTQNDYDFDALEQKLLSN
ncbi:MAG: DnaD domain protein [Lachnospiraceae bacterium]|nr:DnaD domain protein [Lachnospiraceae bacterium]MBP5264636.1 DnaD domain protein [Lachnospiraceae bacterium]MBP5732251.1 DnaD domain protein [Lachnospiraceae bacterium]